MMKECAFGIDLQHKNGIPCRCFSSLLVINNNLFTSQVDDMQHNATLGKDVLATACLTCVDCRGSVEASEVLHVVAGCWR